MQIIGHVQYKINMLIVGAIIINCLNGCGIQQTGKYIDSTINEEYTESSQYYETTGEDLDILETYDVEIEDTEADVEAEVETSGNVETEATVDTEADAETETEATVDTEADVETETEVETDDTVTEFEDEIELLDGFTKVTDTTMYLNVNVKGRYYPDADSAYYGVIYRSDSVILKAINEYTTWCMVDWDGNIRYVLRQYLDEIPPKVAGAAKVTYPLTYSDDTCTIEINKLWVGGEKYGAWTYLAHLQFTDYTRFGTECANGSYRNGFEKTSSVAKRLGAIFCVNGDYSAPRLNYPVTRSGVVWNDKYCTVPGVYSNQTGIFQDPVTAGYNKQLLSELVEDGTVTDTFCFGPYFLINGEITCEYDGSNRAQRTFMGTNGEPGDIWIAVSEGRYVDKVSAGLAYWECANILKENGCTFGLCLDGGGSSTMVFNGHILNHMQGGEERPVVDFVYLK